MSVINVKDYNGKDEFWKAVSSEISVGSSSPSPSGYHRFKGKINLLNGKVLTFERYKEVLSYIGKNYHKTPMKSVEIIFYPAPFGKRPFAPSPKPWK